MRITSQRVAILNNLRTRMDHPTADQVHEQVKVTLPQVSLATVYRNLEDLYKKKEIRKIPLPQQKARFDGGTDPHDHFYCTECNKIFDTVALPLKETTLFPPIGAKFEIQSIEVLLKGLCPKCKNNKE